MPDSPTQPWQKVQVAQQADPRAVTDRLQARLAEKRAVAQRLRRRKYAWWSGVGLIVILIVYLITASSWFRLDMAEVDLRIRGGELDSAPVTALVESYADTPLVILNTNQIRAKISQLPSVAEVEVSRVWPNGLRIELVPAIPVATMAHPELGFSLLAADGTAVNYVAELPLGLPVVDLPPHEDRDRILAAVLQTLAALPIELHGRIGTVTAPTEDSIVFALQGGPRIEWGGAAESALKARVLLTLLENPATAQAAVIDVSAPTLPIVRATE